MTENKRLTPTELRQQQEEREHQAVEAKAAAVERAQKDREAKELAELRRVTEQIKATWYDSVVEAANRPGVRFLVLAQVITSGRDGGPVVTELSAAIQAEGYTCEIVSLRPLATSGPVRSYHAPAVSRLDEAACDVSDDRENGWKPANLPKFGSSGTVRWLVVRW